jgi:hypothetical protein
MLDVIEKTKLKTVEEYRNSPAINQSTLKSISSGYIKRKKPTLRMIIGSLVDALLTSSELFDDLFLIYKGKRPSQVICDIVEHVYNQQIYLNETENQEIYPFEACEFLISDALKVYPYQQNWKELTRINKIMEEGKEYYELMKIKGGRELVTQEEYDKALVLVENLWENSPSKEVLSEATHWQLPMYASFRGEELKGLIDLAKFDYDNQIITLTDAKFSEIPLTRSGIKTHIIKFAYHYQLSYYKNLFEINYPGWTINCQLLFINSFSSKSLVYKLSDLDLEIGKSGVVKVTSQYYSDFLEKIIIQESRVNGWLDDFNIYIQSKELQIEDYNLDYYYNGGVYEGNSIFE